MCRSGYLEGEMSNSAVENQVQETFPEEHLLWVAFQDKKYPQSWRVEMIDYTDGVCHLTIFDGPNCKERAIAYAQWMNAKS